MKQLLCIIGIGMGFYLVGCQGLNRFTVSQRIGKGDGYLPCMVYTDVWDNKDNVSSGSGAIVKQWVVPCADATDSIRKKHLQLADSLAAILNR